MKFTLALLSSALAALALTGCSPGPLSAAQTTDLGEVRLPGLDGYALHGYVVLRENSTGDHVYFLEKDGQPVAGTSTTYQSGKSQVSVSSQIAPNSNGASSVQAPWTVEIACFDSDDCAARAAAANAVARPAPFHCDNLDECKQKLKQRDAQ